MPVPTASRTPSHLSGWLGGLLRRGDVGRGTAGGLRLARLAQVVEPLCRLIEREPADVYVIACASDPGIEAARATTRRPVFGVFRGAVAAAVTRGERFGVIAIVDASKARHLAALRAMGLEDRLAAEAALNVSWRRCCNQRRRAPG